MAQTRARLALLLHDTRPDISFMSSQNPSRRRPRTRLELPQWEDTPKSPRAADLETRSNKNGSHSQTMERGSSRGRERYDDELEVPFHNRYDDGDDGETFSRTTKPTTSRSSRRDAGFDARSSRGRQRYKDDSDVSALRGTDVMVEGQSMDHSNTHATRATVPKPERQIPVSVSKHTSDHQVETAVHTRRARSASASRSKSRPTVAAASAPLPSPRLLPTADPSPRRFLPPSHYAAAAGLHHAKSEHDLHQTAANTSGSASENPVYVQSANRSRNNTISSLPSSPSNQSQTLAETFPAESSPFIPVAYQSSKGHSSTITDEAPTRSLLSRSLSKSKSVSKPKSEQQDGTTLATRASQMGLPTLEASLLPSLRDTIGRMTSPPSIAYPTSPAITYPTSRNTPSTPATSSPQATAPLPPSIIQPESRSSAPPSPLLSYSPTTQPTPLKSALRGARERERERTVTQENWSPVSDAPASPQIPYLKAPPNTPSAVKGSLRTTKRMAKVRDGESPASSPRTTTPLLDEPRTPRTPMVGGGGGRSQSTPQRSAIPVLQKSPAKVNLSFVSKLANSLF